MGTKKVVVVTGGCGFLGSHVVELLIKEDKFDEIRVVDFVAKDLPSHPKVKFMKGNVTVLEDCLRFLEGAHAVFHIAALVDLRESTYCRALSWHVNVQGTWNVVEAAIRRGVKALVYTSSNATIHLPTITTPQNEADILQLFATTTPVSGYGMSKKAATQLALANDKKGGLRTTALMPGAIEGPREPRLLANILHGDPVHVLYPKEAGKLNFCDVISLAQAHLLALDKLLANDERVCGHVFMMSDFIANVTQYEMDLRKALNKPAERILGAKVGFVLNIASVLINWATNDYLNSPFLQMTHSATSIMKKGPLFPSAKEAEQALGWKPVSQETNIQTMVQYHAAKQ